MRRAWVWLAAGGLLLTFAGQLAARDEDRDPPGRVAYLSDREGEVLYSPAGEDVWLDVQPNRPLIRGDRLWTERRSRAELQLGSTLLRIDQETSLDLLALDDDFAQLQITEGTLALSVRRLLRGQVIEIATPNLALSIDQPGRYRIDVDAAGDNTTVVVWEGGGDAWGDRSSFELLAGEAVRFYGFDLRDYEIFGLPRDDAFDRYCLERDRRIARSLSLRYLDDDTPGFAILDDYGSWRSVNDYGHVWFPARVERDWAPYRDGHWVWQEPWGWTWIDAAPWGFAPSHYGRWAYIGGHWGWIPGPRNVRAVYAPALVAFVGGNRWSVSIGSGDSAPIGWFALGPREVYVPSYRASRDYFSRVNVNNTIVNVTVINNAYTHYSRGTIDVGQRQYVHRGLPGAVTVVPSSTFTNARQVRREAIRLERNAIANADNLRVAAVAPSRRAVLGTEQVARIRPQRAVFARDVVARTAPPPELRPFEDREQMLRRTPGRAEAPAAAQTTTRPDNVRVLDANRQRSDARGASSERRGAGRDARSEAMRPLDRSAPPNAPSRPQRDDRAAPQQRDSSRQARDGLVEERQREQVARERQAQDERGNAAREQQRQRQAAEAQQRERERTASDRQAQAERDNAQREQQRQQRNKEDEQREREQAARERQAQAERDNAAREQQRQRREAETQQREQVARERQVQAERDNITREQQRQQREVEVQQREQATRERQAQAERDNAAREQQRQQREAEAQQREQAARERQAQAEAARAEQQEVQRQRLEATRAAAEERKRENAERRAREAEEREDEASNERGNRHRE